MPFPLSVWSPAEMMFVCLVIVGFVVFGVSLFSASTYVARGDRAARKTSVTPAVRPSHDAQDHMRHAA